MHATEEQVPEVPKGDRKKPKLCYEPEGGCSHPLSFHPEGGPCRALGCNTCKKFVEPPAEDEPT
jgi:hypothetical protein